MVSVVTGFVIEWPKTPSEVMKNHHLVTVPLSNGDRLLNAVVAFILAVIVIVVGTFLWALFRAPYEQRGELRLQLQAEQASNQITQISLENCKKAAQTELVSSRHFDELKAIVRRVLERVSNQRPTDTITASDRAALYGHFPDLIPLLTEWDRALQRVYDRTNALKARLAAEAESRGIEKPVFGTDELLPLLLAKTCVRADTGILEAPFDFGWSEASLEEPILFIRTGPSSRQGMITLDAVVGQPPLDADEAKSQVESLFWAAQDWSETHAYAARDRECGWQEVKAPSISRLDELAARDNYRKGDGCPRCA